MGRAVLGVDLGGTNLRAAVVTHDGEILSKHKEATHAAGGKDTVMVRLIESIGKQRALAVQQGYEVTALGVGAPGIIHGEKGVVVKSPNFPDWNNVPLKAELEAALSMPVFIENDANAAALGEQWRGAGRTARSMILITLGTGVGGGIVLDGKIWHGADGMAGEIGHMTLEPDGRPCGCGNTGCLEMYASARAIVQGYREASGEPARHKAFTAEEIYHAAHEGDTVALRVMEDMGRYLGIGMASLINIFNPEMIVIGGGVKDAWPLFIDAARREIMKRAFRFPAERVLIVPSALGDDAGMVGAAAVALQQSSVPGKKC